MEIFAFLSKTAISTIIKSSKLPILISSPFPPLPYKANMPKSSLLLPFDLACSQCYPGEAGIGLLSIRKRINIINGTMNITSSLGMGTTATLVI